MKIETEVISLNQALRSLKLLDKKIQDYSGRFDPVALCVEGDANRGGDQAEFEAVAKAGLQRLQDLILRRHAIKTSLSAANQTARCTISGVDYSIAEAIHLKESVTYKQSLLNSMRRSFARVTEEQVEYNQKVEVHADKLAMHISGKEATQELTAKELQEYTKEYRRNHIKELVDPLGLVKLMDKLNEEIMDFSSNVDSALSDANATNTIKVKA